LGPTLRQSMAEVVEPFRDERIARALSRRIHELFKELSLERLIIMHVCGTRAWPGRVTSGRYLGLA